MPGLRCRAHAEAEVQAEQPAVENDAPRKGRRRSSVSRPRRASAIDGTAALSRPSTPSGLMVGTPPVRAPTAPVNGVRRRSLILVGGGKLDDMLSCQVGGAAAPEAALASARQVPIGQCCT